MEIDLMAPRVKIIAPWLGSGKVEIGAIVTQDESMGVFWIDGEPCSEEKIKQYPHLFQPLPWWSDRKVEEMPEFISYISLGLMDKYNGDKSKAKIIIKIESWSVCEENGKWFFNDNEFNTIHHYHFPATLADYEAFISTTKK